MRAAADKPRPAVIVQADALETPEDVLLCPFTTTLIDAPLYRVQVEPDAANGLQARSQLMADKIGPASRHRIDGIIGRLGQSDMDRLGTALRLMLDLAV